MKRTHNDDLRFWRDMIEGTHKHITTLGRWIEHDRKRDLCTRVDEKALKRAKYVLKVYEDHLSKLAVIEEQ